LLGLTRQSIANNDFFLVKIDGCFLVKIRWMPGSSPLHPIFGSAGPAEHTRPPRQGLKAIAPSRRAARGQQEPPMKLPRTVGLAVAVSLVAATVAALA